RNNMFGDALEQFDRALRLEPGYADAHFYRGLVLERLEKWDDAIAAFKQALPHARPERRVLWSWDAPVTADPSKRGLMFGVDAGEMSLQQDLLLRDPLLSQRRVIYSERKGKNTVMRFVDLEQRRARD